MQESLRNERYPMEREDPVDVLLCGWLPWLHRGSGHRQTYVSHPFASEVTLADHPVRGRQALGATSEATPSMLRTTPTPRPTCSTASTKDTPLKKVSITQVSYYGWKPLGDFTIRSGTVKVVHADNWGTGPHASYIGWDCVEAVPIR